MATLLFEYRNTQLPQVEGRDGRHRVLPGAKDVVRGPAGCGEVDRCSPRACQWPGLGRLAQDLHSLGSSRWRWGSDDGPDCFVEEGRYNVQDRRTIRVMGGPGRCSR